MNTEKATGPITVPQMLFFYEFAGTALLIAAGPSVVIFNFGAGSHMLEWLPSTSVRGLITGFLSGTIGALIAISPIVKSRGVHPTIS
jgi:aquaporin Z